MTTGTSFRLGRVLGFEVRIDSSWFILFFLIVWTFSAMVFPRQTPGYARHVYVLMGVAGALLFFISLLAHELAHSVVARVKGIPVDGITLFLFGGMAHTRMEAQTPGDEFQIAVVGPLMSIFVSVVLGVLFWFGTGAGWSPAVTQVLEYVAVLNLVLAVFNLLPGFPLDGGRLFRAAVWKFTGSALKATRVASAGGRWVGYVLVFFGLLSAFGGNVLGGLWMVFIGWFLRNAAVSSYRQHVVLNLLSGVRAGQAMTPDPETMPADATVRAAMEDYFGRRRYGAWPVLDRDGMLVGLLERHALADVPREDWDRLPVSAVMHPLERTATVSVDDHMVTVLDRLKGSPARKVLVTRDGRLVGLIATSDIAFWLERARQESSE